MTTAAESQADAIEVARRLRSQRPRGVAKISRPIIRIAMYRWLVLIQVRDFCVFGVSLNAQMVSFQVGPWCLMVNTPRYWGRGQTRVRFFREQD